LLVSVDQTTRQRINYFYVDEAISVSEHRAPTYYFQVAMVQHTVYCSHITLFTDLGIGAPYMLGAPGCSPVSTPLNPPLDTGLVLTRCRLFLQL